MKKGKILVFIGPPGSGKGTISSYCTKNLGWEQLSTGDLCRKHIREQTEIGKQIDFFIKSGRLVTDSVIIEMVNQWLEQQLASGKDIILDGYPRTIAQAEALDSLLKEKFAGVNLHVVTFEVPDEVVIERLCERYVCQSSECQAVYSMIEGSGLKPKDDMICDLCASPLKRRLDDTKESVIERLKIYHEHENTLANFYRNKIGKILKLDARKPIEDVIFDFKKLIGIEDS